MSIQNSYIAFVDINNNVRMYLILTLFVLNVSKLNPLYTYRVFKKWEKSLGKSIL